jgi:hypothetical protein
MIISSGEVLKLFECLIGQEETCLSLIELLICMGEKMKRNGILIKVGLV